MADSPNGDMNGQSITPSNLTPSVFPTNYVQNNGIEAHPNGIIDNTFDFVVITKNARIGSIEKIVQVFAELATIPWDIVLFSETRASSGTKVLDGGHILYSTIDESNPYVGVAILLHAKHFNKNIRVYRTSGRVISIDFKMHGRIFCAISTYVPHCGYFYANFV